MTVKSISHLIKDENKAAEDYDDSAKATSHKKAKKLFRHIKGEELHHKKELKELKGRAIKKIINEAK